MVELSALPLFRNISDTGRQLLDQGATIRPFSVGAQLLHKGQAVSGAYYVVAGRLRIYTHSPSGVEATLYSVGPGETCALALNSLFNNLLYPAWVQAECASRIAVIPGEVFRRLFNEEPLIRDTLVQSLATMVFGLMAELQRAQSFPLNQRLANLIVSRAETKGVLRMTQQQMAQHLGTTREVIARLIRAYVSEQYVKTQRGLIVVQDTEALTNIATYGKT